MDSVGELAILIEAYIDSICLSQSGSTIIISRHELKNLIKEIRKIAKKELK